MSIVNEEKQIFSVASSVIIIPNEIQTQREGTWEGTVHSSEGNCETHFREGDKVIYHNDDIRVIEVEGKIYHAILYHTILAKIVVVATHKLELDKNKSDKIESDDAVDLLNRF
jgi:co-chaperonin GroES (HSP10)